MSIWIIEPHDPLIFRDGRPFDATPGAIARSLPFPFPSTIAGGMRTRAGLNEKGRFRFSGEEDLKRLKRLGMRGPILVQLASHGQQIEQWFAPAPFDAQLYPHEFSEEANEQRTTLDVHQLVPQQSFADGISDLMSSKVGQALSLVGMARYRDGKPRGGGMYRLLRRPLLSIQNSR